jgi:hypothetical protein
MSDQSQQSGWNKLGSGYALYSLGGMAISGIIFLIVGIVLYTIANGKKNWKKINAIINTVNCSQSGSTTSGKTNTIKFSCNMNLSYVVNGIKYTNNLDTNTSTNYSNFNNIMIDYNPSDPNEIGVDVLTSTLVGIILIIVGILLTTVGVFGFRYCWKKGCATLGAFFFASDVSSRLTDSPI